MDKNALLDDMEVRFAEPDWEQYGDGWYTYSELAIVSLRARELMDIERQVGVPVAAVLDAFRSDATFANLACAWIAAGRPGDFKDFNPLIMLAEWRVKEAPADLGKSLPEPSVSVPGETPGAPEGFGAFPITEASEQTS